MWDIQKIVSKGDYDYDYAIVKEHPNGTKNHYILLHRVIMENYLGRLLTKDEIVHHKDHNKKNNSLDNLELMTNAEHAQLHMKEQGKQMVILRCPWCKKEFIKERNQTYLVKPSKYKCNCCSSSCRGKLYRYIQIHGVTPEIQDAINNTLISSYKRYLE